MPPAEAYRAPRPGPGPGRPPWRAPRHRCRADGSLAGARARAQSGRRTTGPRVHPGWPEPVPARGGEEHPKGGGSVPGGAAERHGTARPSCVSSLRTGPGPVARVEGRGAGGAPAAPFRRSCGRRTRPGVATGGDPRSTSPGGPHGARVPDTACARPPPGPRPRPCARRPVHEKRAPTGTFVRWRPVSSVREGGVEPPRPCGHWNLNPARLPIPPPAHWVLSFGCLTCCGAAPWRHAED